MNLYIRRCEVLHGIGAYDAAARDAQRALEFEKLSSSLSLGYQRAPYSSISTTKEQGDRAAGATLFRARALCSLGYALLRRGEDLDGARAAFKESTSVTRKGLDDGDDQSSSSAATARVELKGMLAKATEGLSSLKKYETYKKKIGSESDTKDYLVALNGALEICSGAIDLHVTKVRYLLRRRRWLDVANYCERLAAKAVKWEGIFTSDTDLCDVDPLFQKDYVPIGVAYVDYLRKNMPTLDGLTSDFFLDHAKDGNNIPPHLRTLGPTATRDVVFRLPHELLPHYLRSLRLEERYVPALKAGAALSEFIERAVQYSAATGKVALDSNTRLRREFDKLDRTVKLKEEADSLFRDAYYDRAVLLYGQCLAIDGEDGRGERQSILRQSSSWPVVSPVPNAAGGRLHAVLHFYRSACFSALGRQEDAIKEASHAIEIHSTYMKAILHRAKCYTKIGQTKKALEEYDRYVMLVNEARKSPNQSPNYGSACYLDMPMDVSQSQLDKVKREMNCLVHATRKPSTRRTSRTRNRRLMKPASRRTSGWCCMKNVRSQVVEQSPILNPPIVDDSPRRRRVSFSFPRGSIFSVSSGGSFTSSRRRSLLHKRLLRNHQKLTLVT